MRLKVHAGFQGHVLPGYAFVKTHKVGGTDSPSAMPHGSTDAKASLKNVDPERCSLRTSSNLGGGMIRTTDVRQARRRSRTSTARSGTRRSRARPSG